MARLRRFQAKDPGKNVAAVFWQWEELAGCIEGNKSMTRLKEWEGQWVPGVHRLCSYPRQTSLAPVCTHC